MRVRFRGLLQALALLVVGVLCAPARAQMVVEPIGVGYGYDQPGGLVVDRAGNVFVADTNGVVELSAAGGYSTVTPLGTGFDDPAAVAVDGAGNIFIAEPNDNRVIELLAGSAYGTGRALGGSFSRPGGIALDGSGNVFVADTGNNAVKEIPAAGGYATAKAVGGGFGAPAALAVDAHGNVFVADTGNNAVKKILAAGGYATVQTVGGTIAAPTGIALDAAGNAFVANGSTRLTEIRAAGGSATVEAGFDVAAVTIDRTGNLFVGSGAYTVAEITKASGYISVLPIAGPFSGAAGLATDPNGNLYVADVETDTVLRMPAAGFGSYTYLAFGFRQAGSVALDPGGNLFVLDSAAGMVQELTAASGYAQRRMIEQPTMTASPVAGAQSIAVDANDNIFLADPQHDLVRELAAADNYATVATLPGSFSNPGGLAVTAGGDLLVGDTGHGAVKLLRASAGYATVETYTAGLHAPGSVALDGSGNILVVDGGVKQMLRAGGYTTVYTLNPPNSGYTPRGLTLGPDERIYLTSALREPPPANASPVEVLQPAPATPIAAAVLPNARAVLLGDSATVFATMINTGAAPLGNCGIALADPPAGLTLSYQTTDPATNALTGAPDTPVTIPGNDGVQSFVLAFRAAAPGGFYRSVPLAFSCDGAAPAASLPDLNTIDLAISNAATADAIAVAATTGNDGILSVPQGGTAAFAVASTNLGVSDSVTVSVDTGTATLPATLAICQTNPGTGACLAPPAASVTLADPTNAVTTYSVFVQATGPIALAPAQARVFVRFTANANGTPAGLTSVAIETQ